LLVEAQGTPARCRVIEAPLQVQISLARNVEEESQERETPCHSD
jgi:hypothetical protein